LPVVIAAANELYTNADYVAEVERYLELMLENTKVDDWALRYFAAQCYIDLHNRNGAANYLDKAYEIVLNNAAHLVPEQQKLNEAFLQEVVKESVPKGASDEVKKEIENYNRLLSEERKKAAPPVSNALVLNCDLLFALAESRGMTDEEKAHADSILHDASARLFLTVPLDDKYWFNNPYEAIAIESVDISFTKDAFIIPAAYVTADATIKVTVNDENGTHEFADWTIAKVERKDKEDINSFAATYTSSSMKKHDMLAGGTVQIEVLPNGDGQAEALLFEYSIEGTKALGFIPGISYVRTK